MLSPLSCIIKGGVLGGQVPQHAVFQGLKGPQRVRHNTTIWGICSRTCCHLTSPPVDAWIWVQRDDHLTKSWQMATCRIHSDALLRNWWCPMIPLNLLMLAFEVNIVEITRRYVLQIIPKTKAAGKLFSKWMLWWTVTVI